MLVSEVTGVTFEFVICENAPSVEIKKMVSNEMDFIIYYYLSDLNNKFMKITFKSPLILILDGIEKPGNIGALLRTSDAANIDTVFIINQKTDLYNANIIRSSIGCLFSNNIILTTIEKTIEYLKENNIKIFSSFLKASTKYQEINYNEGCAIVLGSEDKGISKKWLDESDELIYIPMQGHIDSLNVSNSGAIIIYEAKRQRNFK